MPIDPETQYYALYSASYILLFISPNPGRGSEQFQNRSIPSGIDSPCQKTGVCGKSDSFASFWPSYRPFSPRDTNLTQLEYAPWRKVPVLATLKRNCLISYIYPFFNMANPFPKELDNFEISLTPYQGLGLINNNI
jgi:hypothetical protein